MSARRQERLVNLTICLLATRRFLSKAQIREAVGGYADLTDQGFDRAFERDKEELRQLGLPLEVGGNDPLFEDEIGYRIRRSELELPEINLSREEATAIRLAADVWRDAAWGEATRAALTKLGQAGARPDSGRLTALLPAVSARGPHVSEATLNVLTKAIVERRELRFGYRAAKRRVHPWRVDAWRADFYLRGFDLDRGESRTFKLSRFESDPVVVGPEAAYEIPAEISSAPVGRPERDREPDSVALVALSPAAPPSLRRRGRQSDERSPVPGMEVYEIGYTAEERMVADLCMAAPEAIALAPDSLRQACIAHLRGAADVR